jgi:hypothetical protein
VARQAGALADAALLLVSLLLSLALLEAAIRLYVWLVPGSAGFVLSDSDAKRQGRWLAAHAKGVRGDATLSPATRHDSLLGWVLEPNVTNYVLPGQRTARQPFNTNSAGLRGRREFSLEKGPGVRRLVAVGDSFTFGLGDTDDGTWPARLGATLPGWEALNLGVYGYGIDQQYLMLRERGMRWAPDVVVFAAYVDGVRRAGMAFRDYAKPRLVLEGDRLRLTNVPVPSPEELLARRQPPLAWRSYLLDFVRWRLWAVAPVDPSDVELERLARAIVAAAFETAGAGGARFLLVVIPMEETPERSQHLGRLFEQWAAELGFPVLNLAEPLAAAERRTGKPMWAGHFTPAGNAEAAHAIGGALGAAGWVP